MDASSTLTDALLAAGAVAIFVCLTIFGLYRVVVWARRGSKRAYALGAALAPLIALGKVTDQDFRVVQEAKQLKKREEDDAGDPPAPEDDACDPRAPEDERR
jgi:hypothetical protein